MVAYYGTNTAEKKFGSTKRVLLVTEGSPVVGTLVVHCISVDPVKAECSILYFATFRRDGSSFAVQIIISSLRTRRVLLISVGRGNI